MRIETYRRSGTDHASPKFMPPRHNGLTRTAAEGDKRRCRPRRLLGSGGIVMKLMLTLYRKLRLKEDTVGL